MRVDVRAMQYEGWVALDERFDDLGVSAGNLERLALRRQLSWCVQGRVDVVVATSLAEFERDIISERLREGKGRTRARGRRAAGRIPLGYRADPNTRQLMIDEDEAALVRAFFERCAAGDSGAAISTWANEAGHRTTVHGGKGGAKWTGRSVLQVVRNPIYLGHRAHGEGSVEGVHDAIVDEDLARRASAALDARRTREPSPRSKAPQWD